MVQIIFNEENSTSIDQWTVVRGAGGKVWVGTRVSVRAKVL